MSSTAGNMPHALQTLPVYRAAAFRVVTGANLGDAVSFADELLLDDCYELTDREKLTSLSFLTSADKAFYIAKGSATGTKGATLYADCCITLMPTTGQTIEALVLVEVDQDGQVVEIYLHPMSALNAKTSYALVKIDREQARRRMALLGCVSFSMGTRITTATGEQKPIQDLCPGDRVLTRDSGVQEIRWIGQSTVRAVGDFAPVVITAGTLHNLGDLTVSQDHRLFIYQRKDQVGAGQAEVMIRARHLVNGSSVYVQNGGFIDYFQLLFDDHQIIFAEGIAAETMLVSESNQSVLPKELGERFRQSQPGLPRADKIACELKDNETIRADVADLLRRASSR